ncbi:MAG: hypothetical protein JW870_09370 [Candidatus Delongbacteria bacterium]|nr:hypothetical protein [Candidatus Delongbacteria bacterium]
MNRNRKGGIILKLLVACALVLLFLSIDIPRRMWNEKLERTKIAHERMKTMFNLSILYMQETGSYNGDLKEVYDFAVNYDTLKVNAPEIETEILDLDTNQIRIDFNDYKRISDLVVTDANGNFIQKIEKDSLKIYQTAYAGSKELNVTLKLRDSKLGLTPDVIKLTCEEPIKVIANRKTEKDIYWDFYANKRIDQERIKPESIIQKVNMARYVIDEMKDTEPYLCPSTKEKFNVNFNLSAKVKMDLEFSLKEDFDTLLFADRSFEKITSNENLLNFFLEKVSLKSTNAVADFVREHEVDGDSTYSNDKSKDSLFNIFFVDKVEEVLKNENWKETENRNLRSIDTDKEKNFSPEKQFNLFFSVTLPAKVQPLLSNEKVANKLSMINVIYNTQIYDIDTLSVKISSPITENSVFRGYERNALESKSVFGVEDDENHGYIDDGDESWNMNSQK